MAPTPHTDRPEPDATHPDATYDDPESEVATRSLSGPTARLATTLAVGLSTYALYLVVGIVQPQIYRVSFLLIALVLTFILYPASRRRRRWAR